MPEIAKALSELGYRAMFKQSDLRKGAVIEATNCVYHTVAKTYPELGYFDIRFIEATSGGTKVKLESGIARGDSVGRFCINKPLFYKDGRIGESVEKISRFVNKLGFQTHLKT